MTNLKLIKVFLERSGAVPLNVDLCLGVGTEVDCELLEAMGPHIQRIRQLSVLGPQRPSYNPSISLTKPAPLLERLVVRCPLGNRKILIFDDQVPRLREFVVIGKGLWLQNQLENLTSLYLTLSHSTRASSDFPLFFDMLRRCPVLEEMFVFWGSLDVILVPSQLPTVPLHRLRKLLLRSVRATNIKYLLHVFDLRADGIAIHLSGVNPTRDGVNTISDVQTIFPNGDSGRPSLVSSTKLELIFHTRPQTVIVHAIGPGFSIRMDLCLDDFAPLDYVDWTFHDVFCSVKELWVRGSPRMDVRLNGIEHFPALEKLVLIGRGSKVARNFRQALSPDHSGVLPCQLLSAIDCYGNVSEMREMFLLVRTRSSAGHRLEKVRVPSSFIPLPADIASCVRAVGGFDIPPRTLHIYAMELPEFCFAEGGHEWWKPWKSRMD